VKQEFPIEVNVDNVGAIYLSKNASTSNRTKHIDTRYHFFREYVEVGILKIKFVRSENNHADIFTKNTSVEIFKKMTKEIMNSPNDRWNEKDRKGVKD
jgi:hypothetical protein